ncbi:MAG: 3'-5' exonuclease [Sphingobacteriales bacterium]|jgi:DNA polymerase III epsilon subunit-like protein|nr:3'-5' exonuclease [Sphingobacteriales bacterium]
MYLFFDTETTGLPRNWKAPASDTNNWPRMVQLAWMYYDTEGTLLASGNHIIRPVGYVIPADVAQIHGITHSRALQEGEDLQTVLSNFEKMIAETNYLVAHNMSFDEKILGAEFIRSNMTDAASSKRKICTMQSTTNFCAIPGPYGYKWPKLSELHYKLFRADFDGAHNAAVDVEVTAKCFWELKRRKLV